MRVNTRFLEFFSKLTKNKVAQSASILLALFATPVVNDGEVLLALSVIIFLDTLTRILANAKDKVSFSFKELIYGIMIKAVGFSMLFIVAEESTKFLEGMGGNYIKATIYFFVPLTEVTSIVKNLVDCGLEQLKPLLQEFQQKIDNPKNDK